MNISFDENIKDQNEKVLKLISKKFNIDINELTEEVINVFPNFVKIKKIDYDEAKCRAIIIVTKNKQQCSRAHHINNFCKLHHKMFEKCNLKYGYINIDKPMFLNNIKDDELANKNEQTDIKNKKLDLDSVVDTNDENSESELIDDEIKDENIKTEVQRIIINQKEYLINPFTSYIYDFKTRKNIGVLDDDDNIISNYAMSKKKLEKSK